MKNASAYWLSLLLVALLGISPLRSHAETPVSVSSPKLTAVGTTKIWGMIAGIQIEGVVQGPSTEETPLQIVCVFEYTEGDIYTSPPALPAAANGMVHLDQALGGLITDLRKSGQFTGHAFETLLLTPPSGKLSAQKLLIIGLGDRNHFTPDLMIPIGTVALREALKLGVTRFAFASDLKDAGLDSPTALVAGNVLRGMSRAYRTELDLKQKGVSATAPLTKISLLAGTAFFTEAGAGIQSFLREVQEANPTK